MLNMATGECDKYTNMYIWYYDEYGFIKIVSCLRIIARPT